MTLHKKIFLIAALAAPGLLLSQQPDRFAAIAPRMQEFVDKGEAAGIVTLVATRDRILHLGAVGKTDMHNDRKMQTGDIFWIASMSKPITSVCIAILADEGKLKFDDPLAKHLPEFAGLMVNENGQTVKPSRPVTLRDVMTHTSGFGDMTNREPASHAGRNQRQAFPAAAALPAGKPLGVLDGGDRHSGPRGGSSRRDAVRRVSAEARPGPAGNEEHQLLDRAAKDLPRYALSYRWNAPAGKLEETTIPYLYKTAVTDRQRPPLGGAGLFSTAEDIARFYQMMLNQGALNGKRILKPETVAEMTRKQTGALNARPGMPWGLGFCVVEDPTKMAANSVLSPGSFGHGGAFSTQSWADPAQGISSGS